MTNKLSYQQVELQLETLLDAAKLTEKRRCAQGTSIHTTIALHNAEREYHDELATMLAMLKELTDVGTPQEHGANSAIYGAA